jgi:hypothetical protein
MRRQKTFFIALLLTILVSSQAGADTSRFSVVTAYPVPDGGPYFTVASSDALAQLQWHAGTSFDFAYKPLKTTTQGVIDRLLIEHFYGALGLTDWVSLGIDMPMAWMNHFADPETVGSRATSKTDPSDLLIQAKFRILDKATYPVGLAIITFMTAPTGKEAYFVGDDGVTGGGMFVLDGGIADRVNLALNAGIVGHKAIKWHNVDRSPISLKFGAGVAVKAVDGLSFTLDLRTETSTNHFFSKRADAQTEVIGGPKWDIGDSGFELYAAGGAGIVREAGAPVFRGVIGVSYTSKSRDNTSKSEEK